MTGTAQPPLPLHEFLPPQPLSPDLQPPWALQEFMPLQACLSAAAADVLASFDLQEVSVVETAPNRRPATAADTRAVLVFFMVLGE